MKSFSLIVAINNLGGIGRDGVLPWRIPADLKFFANVTTNFGLTIPFPNSAVSNPSAVLSERKNAVIMGRKTWESIPAKFRPLKERLNVVLSRNDEYLNSLPSSVLTFKSLDAALIDLSNLDNICDIFIIGGGLLYTEAMQHPLCGRIFLTQILTDTEECDTFFPHLNPDTWRRLTDEEMKQSLGDQVPLGKRSENGMDFEFRIFERLN
ncbi:dihydrofolate reductase [Nowakowskiella sp. JEL0407]|nr:dihydrofolate reductase [Nowakowskiella sp. JEL0407]